MKQELEPRLEEAKTGKRVVYFADAVHFVFGAFVACLWSLKRIFVPTPAGRNRYNVLGAIDAISHELLTVCNTTYINALSVCDLLEQITQKHLGTHVTQAHAQDVTRAHFDGNFTAKIMLSNYLTVI